MKKIRTPFILIIFTAIVFSVPKFFQHTQITQRDYYASRVIDGDTIELSHGEKVRYIGIDTPEIRERQGSKWLYRPMPYAEEAKDFNRRLVEGKPVRLEFDVQKRDRYNRLLAYVYAGDKMVNLEMVKEGYAMIYTYPPNVKYVDEFLEAQREARENKRGLWSDLKASIISSSEAKENIGRVRMVETEVYNTFISNKLLILNCRDNFKAVIFKNNLPYFPKEVVRSPDTYFRHKTIRLYGLIENYKGSPEIILHDPSQLEIIRDNKVRGNSGVMRRTGVLRGNLK
jgi:micrococcal nuclease